MNYLKKHLNYKKIMLLLYIIITLIVTLNHEPWRDEAQAWLITNNLKLLDIIKQMRFEGHPCLWHLFLYPFTRINLPYQYINIISWLLGCISTTIIIKKSPFNNYTNTAIILSTPILYYYIVLSRSYSLILLLIAILMLIYQKRDKLPIIYGLILALLTNTHILICPLVGILMLENLYEIIKEPYNRKKKIISLIIQIIGVILLVLQLYTSLTNNAENSLITESNMFSAFFDMLKTIITGNYILFMLILFSLIALIISLYKQKFIFIATILTLLFFTFINNSIYSLGTQHVGLIHLSILFYAFMAKKKNPTNKLLEISLLIFFLVTAPYGIYLSVTDITTNFSNAKDTAYYIEENIPTNNTLLCVPDDKCISIVPYIQDKYKFIGHYTQKEFTFVTWSKDRRTNPYVGINNIIKNNKIKYIIHASGINDPEIERLKRNKILKTIKTFDERNVIGGYLEEYEILEVIKEY